LSQTAGLQLLGA